MKSLADNLYERISVLLKIPTGDLDTNDETVILSFKPAPRYAGYRLCRWVFTQVSLFIPFALFLLPNDFYGILEQMGFGWIQNINYNTRWQENMPEFMKLPVNILTVGGYLTQLIFSLVFTFLSAKSQSYLLTD